MKRQHLLLLLCLGSAAYTLLDQFGGESGAAPVATPAQSARKEAAEFVARLGESMDKSDLSRMEKVVLRSVQDPWRDGLFMAEPKVVDGLDETSSAANPGLVYQGYLKLGGNRLAIINGMEYELGDELPDGVFTVYDISPAKVLLHSKNGSGIVELAYEEEQRPAKHAAVTQEVSREN